MTASPERCPGIYCGRTVSTNDSWSDCGACPQGYRVTDNSSACTLCLDHPSAYDWLYLVFMAVIALILHWFFIDMVAKSQHFSKGQLILHLSAFVEVMGSAAVTLMIFEPMGSLYFHSCSANRLSDWYTLFHNPTPNYSEKLHCSHEAVYPLQTMVLVFYLLCILSLMFIRPWLNRAYMKDGKSAVYCALYFLPILALFHTIAGGLIYYAFPYLSIVISMISNAAHFSMKLDQDMNSLIMTSVTEIKNSVIIVGHWLLLAFGIVALHQHLAFLAFVPLPAIFYVITVKFTNPGEMHVRDERIST